jgi:hypothetical protein
VRRSLNTHLCLCPQVSGEANETQIAEALRRYSERAFFVREALFHLFSLTHVMEKTKPDILKVRTRNWGGEMAQWLRSLAAFPKDPGSNPSTYMAVHNSSSRGSDTFTQTNMETEHQLKKQKQKTQETGDEKI